MTNSNDTIGNRTRNLPACSAVPQPTAPPHTRDELRKAMTIVRALASGRADRNFAAQRSELISVAILGFIRKRYEGWRPTWLQEIVLRTYFSDTRC